MNVDPTKSKLLFGNRHQAVADGESTVAVKVRLRDFKNRPIAGRVVELQADRDGVEIEQPPATDAEGLAVGFVRATTVGPVSIRGVVMPLEEEGSSAPL